jgi:hypothetical protein
MICAHCLEEIHESDGGGWYHVKAWVERTADHEASPTSEVQLGLL